MNKYSNWRYNKYYIIIFLPIILLVLLFLFKTQISLGRYNSNTKGVIINIVEDEHSTQWIEGGEVNRFYRVIVKYSVNDSVFFENVNLNYKPINDTVDVRYNIKKPDKCVVQF